MYNVLLFAKLDVPQNIFVKEKCVKTVLLEMKKTSSIISLTAGKQMRQPFYRKLVSNKEYDALCMYKCTLM